MSETTYRQRRESFLDDLEATARDALPDDPSFDDYLEPYGDYGLPIYTGFPDDHEIVHRIVERRADWLEAQEDYPLNEQLAATIAWKEATGGSATGLAKKLDVTASTVKGYVDRITRTLGHDILIQEPFHEIDRPLPLGGPNLRECPSCGEPAMCALVEIPRVFTQMTDGMKRAYDSAKSTGATHMCSMCHQPQRVGGDDGGPREEITGYYSNVPEELQAVDRWIVWEDREVGEEGRSRKMPIAPWATEGVRNVNAHNPFAWTSFEEAADWAQKMPGYGLMFVIRPDDPYVLVDLDECVEDGDIPEEIRGIIGAFDSYAELSPSGTGIHIICKGSVPAGYRNVEGFEIYDGARPCTFTGNRVGSKPVAEAQDAIESFCDEYLREGVGTTVAEIGGGREANDVLANLSITDLYPDLVPGQNHAHPVHGSNHEPGANFRPHADNGGETAMCWRCEVGLNAGHLIAMEALGIDKCDEARARWRQDDEAVLETWVYAVQELGLDPDPPPSRAILHLARMVGMDPDEDYRLAWDTGEMVARKRYGFAVGDDGDDD